MGDLVVRDYFAHFSFMIKKRCFKCEKILDISCFVKNATKKDGHGHLCKECNTKYHQQYQYHKKGILRCEDLQGEVWVEVPGFEGVYMASDKSRIKSLPRSTRRLKEIILVKTEGDYLTVTLVKDGIRHTCATHVLFATLFIENPENLPVVNHKNGNKFDDSLGNLEWTTFKGNTDHAFKNGMKDNFIGEKSNLSKLKNNQVLDIVKSSMSNPELAKKYNVTPECISKINIGKSWSYITGIKYVRKKKKA